MPVNRQTDPDGLTIKQRAFVHAYCGPAQGNGALAAKMAGYKGSASSHKNAANKLVNHPLVSAAIRAFADKVEDESVMPARERQQWLTALVRGEIGESVMVEDQVVEVPARIKDRLTACDQLNKMQGVYTERREVDHRGASVTFVYEDNGRGPAPKG